mmetsp:Transcript_12558/g.12603  ORF Transcript_12558/g.12603 Transcript_12558/m.12603 type:complete len:95 (+) Transcript_12558:452-736(+)|eukprot:CAMPEP_0197019422 /NCGR_PEP_ID=MMETSP1380-20130617/80692_1 /TAXON_ID=5936 /ORGANISM="Euplotes crassus, Strain CT5" /LENGTH=94 /DNA_ID=CAMNT_0042446839 /DNA_START=442 /DNA_END=726 /DNA_ORIENTATION=+
MALDEIYEDSQMSVSVPSSLRDDDSFSGYGSEVVEIHPENHSDASITEEEFRVGVLETIDEVEGLSEPSPFETPNERASLESEEMSPVIQEDMK